MAIALSGLVKAALAWRAGEKEMIGGWVGGGEGSFVLLYCITLYLRGYCILYICVWLVAERATLYLYSVFVFV